MCYFSYIEGHETIFCRISFDLSAINVLSKFRGSRKIFHFQTVSDRAEFVLALCMVPMLVLYPSAAAVGSFFDH